MCIYIYGCMYIYIYMCICAYVCAWVFALWFVGFVVTPVMQCRSQHKCLWPWAWHEWYEPGGKRWPCGMMHHAWCIKCMMHYAPHNMIFASCIVHSALCISIMHHASCIMHRSSLIVHFASCIICHPSQVYSFILFLCFFIQPLLFPAILESGLLVVT